MKKCILAFLFFLFLYPINSVGAQGFLDIDSFFDSQTGLPTGVVEQISVEVLPKIPNPGDRVLISVESYSTDFNSAYFTWTVDGVVGAEGYGVKSFDFFAPESGRSTTIELSIQKEEGGTLSRRFAFSPADVDIIYEADTYTHPFYKGKALFSSESIIRFVAMPNFVENSNRIPASSLVYKWIIDGNVDSANSGYGRNVYTGKGSLIQRPFSVSVEVTAPNSDLTAKNTIFLDDTEPDLVIYEDNPLQGILFENAIQGEFILERPEVVFQAIPYYYSTKNKDDSFIDYSWRMNGERIEFGSTLSSISFRNDSGEAGRAIISLDVEHFQNILQAAQASVNLIFSETENVDLENNFEF